MSQKKINKSRDSRPDISECEPAIKECVRYILCREGGKIPIKRADINKHLNNVCQTPQNQVSGVISEANKVLKKVSIVKFNNETLTISTFPPLL